MNSKRIFFLSTRKRPSRAWSWANRQTSPSHPIQPLSPLPGIWNDLKLIKIMNFNHFLKLKSLNGIPNHFFSLSDPEWGWEWLLRVGHWWTERAPAWGYIPATVGEHPSLVPQYTKDHSKAIISLPPDWLRIDTTQMILGVLAHLQRVSSSPIRADEI